ncbi:MAG TPA: hypothetical protein VMS56_03055 [Thermoanaerobaculia bacterium]|nr:hypothetical protein [Thermoanaerobaculia bacterium]
MKRAAWFSGLLCAAVLLVAAPPLFRGAAESSWEVAGVDAASVTVLTDGRSVRAEWNAGSGAPIVFIATEGKIWVRDGGGDVELAQWRGGDEKIVVPALLLPYTTTAKDRTTLAGGNVETYGYGGATATYSWDAKGPSGVEVKAGAKSWTLSRKKLGSVSSKDASLYEVKPKQGASSRLAALAGGLFGSSDRSVSATAGGRGVEKGARFEDGGDYEALAAIEIADDEWDDEAGEELAKFQNEGNVGRGRGGDR